MMRMLAAMTLLLTMSSGADAAYTCTSSIFTKRCACDNLRDCRQMRADEVCGAGTVNMLCNSDGSRCVCNVSRLPLFRVQPPPVLSQ